MEEEVVSINQVNQPTKLSDKKIIKNETCVNSKDSINWMIYSFFLRHVNVYIYIGL
jgi:hypothetical protein